MYKFLLLFLTFIIYSVIGWICEVIYMKIETKKLMNRGFLIGPYCPIYGVGSIGMIYYLDQYKSNILTVFILAVSICSILEYLTSYIMELIFKIRWWDYSHEKFNLNGRICGKNAILFGMGGILIIYLSNPLIAPFLNSIDRDLINIIGSITFIIFTIDLISSCNIITKLKKSVSSIEIKKDSTEEITKMVREKLMKGSKILQRRLYDAFPDINLRKILKFKKRFRLFKK